MVGRDSLWCAADNRRNHTNTRALWCASNTLIGAGECVGESKWMAAADILMGAGQCVQRVEVDCQLAALPALAALLLQRLEVLALDVLDPVTPTS